MRKFLLISVVLLVSLANIAGSARAAPSPVGMIASSRCNTRYPNGFFRVCYYQGTEPETGAFLGSEDEDSLGAPVPERAFGINHDWGQEPVFGGITPAAGGAENDISGVWRGRLFFHSGRYQFTAFVADGVRLFIDEQSVIDEWRSQEQWRFGAVVELAKGFHDIRVEWFATGLTPEQTFLRLHWDWVPTAANPQVSPIVIDVFLLRQQEACLVGDPWVSGEPVVIHNPDGTPYRIWQVDEVRGLPRALAPSDPTLSNYPQVECFSFGYRPEEIPSVKAEVDEFAALIEQWSGGDIAPIVRLFEIEGEVNLGRIGTTWWVAPGEIASLATPLMTTETDFAIVLSSSYDIETRRSYEIFGCGGSFGVEWDFLHFGGTGYSWVTCVEGRTILHEWEHQFTAAMRHLLQFDSLYVDRADYPPCGMGDPDTFKWFPDSEDWGVDPDSPWCGPTAVVGIGELHLFAHFDASLSHYSLGYITGNRCNDGIQDFGESQVDTGGHCPANGLEEEFELAPTDDAWVNIGAPGGNGTSNQLKIQTDKQVAYLRFDLRNVSGTVSSAVLTATPSQCKAGTVSAHAVTDSDWQEEAIKGTNAPAIGEPLDSAVLTRTRCEEVRWDVTPFVAEAVENGTDAVSFALVMTEGHQIAFSSKENRHGNKTPVLAITAR